MKNKTLSTLKKYFSHNSFMGSQEEVITTLLKKRKHCLVVMPTGSGKSLCYQLPALLLKRTIVISPLIALMQDQVEALRKKNISATYINSTVSKKDREARLAGFIEGRYKLLYVTPERFRKKEFVQEMGKAPIDLLAVDEAHCISCWGHDFRPDYSRIAEFRQMMANPLTIGLTATATPLVREDIVEKLGLKGDEIEIFDQGIGRPNLRLEARAVYDDDDKLDCILESLEKYPGSGIVYFSLIKTLNHYSELMRVRKIPHFLYHGKMEKRDRKKAQRNFLRDEKALVLATNAFGMGIDKPDIRLVIHGEIPGSIESYYQEIGRAGRDGLPSLCLLLYQQADLAIQMDFIDWANPDRQFYSSLYNLLKYQMEKVNSMDLEDLREELVFKNRGDFRLETALGMLERFGVIEGDLTKGNLSLVGDLSGLFEGNWLEEKLMGDRKRLLSIMEYFKEEKCRREFISRYFGVEESSYCGNCDLCDKGSIYHGNSRSSKKSR